MVITLSSVSGRGDDGDQALSVGDARTVVQDPVKSLIGGQEKMKWVHVSTCLKL